MTRLGEQFMLSFSPDAPDFPGEGELTPEVRDSTLRDFAESDFDTDGIELRVGSAGYGAEAFVLLAIFTGLATVFLSGKKIEENLEAWIKLGRRFRSLLKRLKQRRGGFSASQPVALALVLDQLATDYGDLSGSKIFAAHKIPVHNASIRRQLEPQFEFQPDRFYLFLVRMPNDDICVVGIRSDGTVSFSNRVPTGNYLHYFGVIDERDGAE